MRVIAGNLRGRQIRSMRGMDVRPTSDRLRETLFNVLTAGNPKALEGSVWIDLFAGTGAVGIEALSRGAAKVWFVEKSKKVAQLIRENLDALDIPAQAAEILNQDVVPAIQSLSRRGVKPQYIFLDPPYARKPAYGDALEEITKSSLMGGTLVIAEHERQYDPGKFFADLRRSRKMEQGDAALSFYRADTR